MSRIFHITSQFEWEKAIENGYYSAPSLRKDGFIHCSLVSQVLGVANFKYKGQQDLLLLEIEEAKLKYPVKYEDLYNLDELCPHIYGPLNLDAVMQTVRFLPEKDGTFRLPEKSNRKNLN